MNALTGAASLGCYPPGPDVALFSRMIIWAVMAIALSVAGLLSGSLLRRLTSQ